MSNYHALRRLNEDRSLRVLSLDDRNSDVSNFSASHFSMLVSKSLILNWNDSFTIFMDTVINVIQTYLASHFSNRKELRRIRTRLKQNWS